MWRASRRHHVTSDSSEQHTRIQTTTEQVWKVLCFKKARAWGTLKTVLIVCTQCGTRRKYRPIKNVKCITGIRKQFPEKHV